MNKSVIIGAIVVILAAIGIYQWSRNSTETAAPEPATATQNAVEGVGQAADEAAGAVQDAAEDAKGAVEDAVEGVEGGVDEAAKEVEESAAGATEEPAAPVEPATDASPATEEVAPIGTNDASNAAAVLDPSNFDASAISKLIEGSSLDEGSKRILEKAVDAANANPALVADTIAQIKAALGQ